MQYKTQFTPFVMIRVILVDDHDLYRLGVKTAINQACTDIVCLGEADSGHSLYQVLQTTEADLVLLDIILPDISGVDIARHLKQVYPELKILTISAENSQDTVQAMLEVGVNGFISKGMGGVATLIEAIRTVMSGIDYFGSDIAGIISQIYLDKKKTTQLSDEFTAQEKRIIELCQQGLSAKLIADKLCISPRTVDNHKNNIFRKLGINSSLEMVQYALQKGIIRIS